MTYRRVPTRFHPIWVAYCAALACLVFCLGCQPTAKRQPNPKKAQAAQEKKTANSGSNYLTATGLANDSSSTTSSTGQASDDNRTDHRTSVKPHPKTHNFTDAQLNKDHTLCVLAFDSFTRYSYFLSHYRHLMTPEQIEKARTLVDSFEPEFSDLARERELILNTATNSTDVPTLLKNNSIEVLLVSRRLRRKIMHEIYTREQLRQYNEEYEANRRKKMTTQQTTGPK